MFSNIVTHFTDAEISLHQLLGMQGPHIQNIQQQADSLSIQAESIIIAAKAIYAENTTLHKENTKFLHKEHINVITALLHQLQMQMAAQAFTMITQTMEPSGHSNTQCNKCRSHGGGHGGTTTLNTAPPVMQLSPTFN